MTPAEEAIAAQALVDQFAAIVVGQPLSVVLMALLSTYRTTALLHPRSGLPAAEQCVSVGLELAARYADRQPPPPGASIH